MRSNLRTTTLLLALAALISLPLAQAGGPLATDNPSGTPFVWPGAPPTAVHNIEIGPWNGATSNAAGIAEVTASFGAWTAVPTASLVHVTGATLVDPGVEPAGGSAAAGLACPGIGIPIDVDETNFFCVFLAVPDGQSPVIFDDDGVLFDFLFGPGSGVLGFSGPDFVTVAAPFEIVEGVQVLNGFAIGSAIPDIDDIITHEAGHYSNLAHTVTNGEILAIGDFSGPDPFDTFGFPAPAGSVETMYPFAFVDTPGSVFTPHPDDIAILSTIYPAAGFPGTFGTISGTILDTDSVTGLTGINVIARNVADPFFDAVSAISGDFTQGGGALGLADGSYTINGLTPGADYAVFIDGILAGGFSTPLLSDDPFFAAGPVWGPFPGPEDFWNGASESFDVGIDDPSIFVPITVAAGAPVTGIDIIINGAPPVPDPNEPNDDFASATAIGCGFTSVDTSISPAGGDVDYYILTGTPGDTLAIDIDAAELGSSLDPVLGAFDSSFVSLGSSDDAPAPGEPFTLDSFLSGIVIPGDGIVYIAVSAFSDFDFDGDGGSSGEYTMITTCTAPVVDPNEPNDDFASATPRTCGFLETGVAIDPAADLDFYEVTGTAGDVMTIDINADSLGSGLDSIVTAYDSSFAVLGSNDDEAFGVTDSLLDVIIPGDGIVFVEVVSFAGGSSGFYEMDVSCATPPMGDVNEPNNDFATATPKTCPFFDGTNTITPDIDVDFFIITGTPGEVMSIDIDADEIGSTLDSIIEAFDSSFVSLGVDDDGEAPGEAPNLDSFLQVLIPGDGIVYVSVEELGNNNSDFYEIDVSCAPAGDTNEPNDDFATATAIGCGFVSAGTDIFPTGDVDYYLLTGPAGALVDIDVDAAEFGSSLDSVLGTFDSAFTPLSTADDSPAPGEPGTLDSYIQETLPGDGLLYIAVASYNDLNFNGDDGDVFDTGGPYDLLVTCTIPCDDTDGDGWGTNGSPLCPVAGDDCDDTDPNVHPPFGSIELISNGDFEGGSLVGWTVDTAGFGSFFTIPNGGTTPVAGFATDTNATGGTTNAVSDDGAGTKALSQTFFVPAGVDMLTLSYDMFVNDWSGSGGIIDPIGLDHTAAPNQHARVDLLTAGSPAFDTGAGVITNFYIGVDPSDPNVALNPWVPYSFDITTDAPAGSSYTLRFAETDNQFFLHQGVDNVSIVAGSSFAEVCDNGIDDDCDGLIDAADTADCDQLLAEIVWFRAVQTPQGVQLEWRTALEKDHTGFNIVRRIDGVRKQDADTVTPEMIPAAGSDLRGADYQYLDATKGLAGHTVAYYLESVDLFGNVETHGPAIVELQATPRERQAAAPRQR